MDHNKASCGTSTETSPVARCSLTSTASASHGPSPANVAPLLSLASAAPLSLPSSALAPSSQSSTELNVKADAKRENNNADIRGESVQEPLAVSNEHRMLPSSAAKGIVGTIDELLTSNPNDSNDIEFETTETHTVHQTVSSLSSPSIVPVGSDNEINDEPSNDMQIRHSHPPHPAPNTVVATSVVTSTGNAGKSKRKKAKNAVSTPRTRKPADSFDNFRNDLIETLRGCPSEKCHHEILKRLLGRLKEYMENKRDHPVKLRNSYNNSVNSLRIHTIVIQHLFCLHFQVSQPVPDKRKRPSELMKPTDDIEAMANNFMTLLRKFTNSNYDENADLMLYLTELMHDNPDSAVSCYW